MTGDMTTQTRGLSFWKQTVVLLWLAAQINRVCNRRGRKQTVCVNIVKLVPQSWITHAWFNILKRIIAVFWIIINGFKCLKNRRKIKYLSLPGKPLTAEEDLTCIRVNGQHMSVSKGYVSCSIWKGYPFQSVRDDRKLHHRSASLFFICRFFLSFRLSLDFSLKDFL